MVKVKVCHSELVDTRYAINEILEQSWELIPQDVKGILVFSSVDFDLKLVASELTNRYSTASIVGGSSFGEMSSSLGWREDSLVVGFLYGDHFNIETIGIENISESLDSKLRRQFDQLVDPKSAKVCILVADAFSVGGESIIQNIREYLPDTTPIIGGMAADRWTFTETKQIYDGTVFKNGLAAMLISGDFEVEVSTETGWEPHRRKVVVTKSEGHIVYEINKVPALDFYAETFGTRDGTYGEYPLAIYRDNEVAYLRAPLTWDQKTGSVSFAGTVPNGATVSISSTSRELAIKAATSAIKNAALGLKNEAEWAFITSCAARRQLLGTQAGKEIKMAKDGLNDIPILGFNSYGEFLDIKQKYPDTPGFLNESFCVVLFGKK